jgi:tetratricopeptide (TPR) repeat protein
MDYFGRAFLFLIMIFLTACGISRQVSELQTNAEAAFNQENYQEALNLYQEIIELKNSRDREIDGITWYSAGLSAWETGQTLKATEYLEMAASNGFTSEKTYYMLSGAYRLVDNLSREISNLESYISNYPEGGQAVEMRKRLFEAYIESKNFDLALELWPDMTDSQRDSLLLDGYFIVNKELGNEDDLEKIAGKLLEIDRKNINALEYLAEKYFRVAENRYQEELEAYEKNRTRPRYRDLLAALDEINEQFRLSRDYFERLYAIAPSPRYAAYLRNIYIRFGNEEKAGYFEKKSQISQ